MPTTPALAPIKGTLGLDRTTGDYYPRTLSLTAIAGIGRLPQVTLPVADVSGVPIGLSLLARHGRDGFLLAAAQLLAQGSDAVNPASRGTNRIGSKKTPCKANDAVFIGHLSLREMSADLRVM